MQWLNAHHVHSPITRHALVVLESIDAVDLAFDTFVCSLLDGEVDTSGYPEYNAIVGGVAAHWDEATGDMICRAVVGWGGKGVRGDTDRIGAKLLGGILSNILASQYALGLTADRAAGARPPAAAGSSARTAGSPPRTSGPSTARSAACACSAAERRPRDAHLRLRVRGVPPAVRGDPRRPRRRPDDVPAVRQGPGPKGDHRRRPSTTRAPAGPRRNAARRVGSGASKSGGGRLGLRRRLEERRGRVVRRRRIGLDDQEVGSGSSESSAGSSGSGASKKTEKPTESGASKTSD